VIAVRKSPADLYDALSGKIPAPYVIGATILVNTIYIPGAGTVDVYIDGMLVEEKPLASAPIYNVVGVWVPFAVPVAVSGMDEVTWRDILFWKGGIKQSGGFKLLRQGAG
jgi:hypothetical protein